MPLTYDKLELLICLHFPTAANGTRRACHFDVASSPFKCHFSALMWLCGTLKNPLDLKEEKRKELIKHTECSDVLVQCE